MSHGRANPMTLGLGVAPSYRTGAVTVFGGAFARNHPTTLRKEINTSITFRDDDGDVRSGPVNVLLHAGVELALAPRLAPSSSSTRTSSPTRCATDPASASRSPAGSAINAVPDYDGRSGGAARGAAIRPA
jgi:hypothetical protein